MFDLEANGKDLTVEEILELHRLKTGELFKASVEVGAVLGRASKDEKQSLINFAHDFGLAFQIKDDILDFLEAKSLGKKCDETNIVNAIGIEASKHKLNQLHLSALFHLKNFGNKAALLQELTDFIVNRDK
jgi:geranylgeranyl pyrophosphate synthase